MRIRSFTFLICFVLAVGFIGCKKDEGNDTTHLSIFLAGNPYAASKVNIDLREVLVNLGTDSTSWTSIHTNAGVYNLLNLQNGKDTVIAQGIIPTGTLREVRFVLGDGNTIEVNDIIYPMKVPAGGDAGLRIKMNRPLSPTMDSLVINFDAGLSISQTTSGDYLLRPVLQVK